MSNVTVPNFATATNDMRPAIWKLSRALKAAGWVTKSSSDGTTKDTTGSFINDKWNGVVGTGGSGAAASITVANGGQVTLTGLTGFASGTAGQRWINIAGAASAANDGYFKILTFVSATSVTIFNPNAVAPDANNGSISWTEYIPLSDTNTIGTGAWINMQGPSTIKIPVNSLSSGSIAVNSITGNNQTGSTARYSAPSGLFYNNLPIITGLQNMSYASVGRTLTISGAGTSSNNGTFVIVDYINPTSVVVSNLNPNYSDSNNGSLTWTENTTTPFIRGENVTQTGTGAQGELIGQHFDYTTGTGYLVIQPRFYGIGSVLGWDGYETITGATSGASVTPAGLTPSEFVREIVLWTGNPTTTTNFTGYMQTVDGYSESSIRFSSLATSTGATATIAPGGGGTNNSFPTYGSYVFCGTGGSKSDGRIFMTTWTGTATNAQIMCADATYYPTKSADGSFIIAVGVPTTPANSVFIGYAFTRVDDHEDGDVDPYVFYCPSNTILYGVSGTDTRTVLTASYTVAGEQFVAVGTSANNSSISYNNTFRGLRRRGFNDTADAFQNFQVGMLCTGTSNPTGGNTNGSGNGLFNQQPTDPETVATAQDSFNITTASAVLVSEPVWVISTNVNQRMFKGGCRWLRFIQQPSAASGTPPDTIGGKNWLQLGVSIVSMMGGPWDGSTTPTH